MSKIWNEEVLLFVVNFLLEKVSKELILELKEKSQIVKEVLFKLNEKFNTDKQVDKSDLFDSVSQNKFTPSSLLIELWGLSMDMSKLKYGTGFIEYIEGENKELIRLKKSIFIKQENLISNLNFCIKNLSDKTENPKHKTKLTSIPPSKKILNDLVSNVRLDELKKESGKFYNHFDKEYNLVLSNDGTGSGKTRNVVVNFIEQCSNLNESLQKHSLVVVVPQKNQFPIYHSEALSNKIPLLWARSVEDLVSMESQCLIDDFDSSNRKTLGDFYKDLFSGINVNIGEKLDSILLAEFNDRKTKKFKDEENSDEHIFLNTPPSFERLRGAFNKIAILESEVTNINSQKEKEELIFEIQKAKIFFRKSLHTLLDTGLVKHYKNESLFSRIFTNITININQSSSIECVIDWLTRKLSMLLIPFEVSKYINCIIFMTADKSKQTFGHVITNKTFQRIVRHRYVEEIVSNKKVVKDQNLIETLKMSNLEFGNYISENYFESVNPEEIINTTYSIMYDEEHAVSTKFTENYTTAKITTNYFDSFFNMLQAIVAMGKWIEELNLPLSPVNNEESIKEDERKITKNFINNLKSYSTFDNDDKIKDFFNFIKGNQDGIYVSPTEHDLIKDICDNLLAFTPKMIVHKNQLEGLKLLGIPGGKHLILTSNIDMHDYKGANSQATLYDLFTVALILLYSCRNASDKLCKKYLDLKSEDNQFTALSHCFKVATKYKDFLNNILNSHGTIDEDQMINIQFTYFIKKIGFKVDFPKIINAELFDEKYIKVTPEIFILNELQEVEIYQSLQKKGNIVFLLSATRGFNDIFAGNFSKEFFVEMESILPGKISIKERYNNPNKPNIMPEFIEQRFKERKSLAVEFVNFNPKTLSVNIENYSLKSIYLDNDNSPKIIKNINTYSISNESLAKKYQYFLSNIQGVLFKASLFNDYHKKELLNTINSLFDIANNPLNEHSIIMNLTNNFQQNISSYRNILSDCTDFGDYNDKKIFEWQYDTNNPQKKLRIICYDANLYKKHDLDKCFIVSDSNTKVVIISCYQSAGTGLNFTINNNTDFNNIYLISDSFYTSVKNKESGFANTANLILIMKSMAHKGTKTLKDLTSGLKGNGIREILIKEHNLEKTKTIMQAIGRIERRDFPIHSKIKIVDNDRNIKDIILGGFLKLFSIHGGEVEHSILSNLSMNNKAIMSVALSSKIGLPAHLKNKLVQESVEKGEKVKEIFEYFYTKVKPRYAIQEKDYLWFNEFNEIIRNYTTDECIPRLDTQLESFILNNKDSILKEDIRRLQKLKNNLYIELGSEYNGYILTLNTIKNCYSDLSESDLIVNWDFVYGFGLVENIVWDNKKNQITKKIINWLNLFNEHKETNLEFLPSPYLLYVLRGNRGEQLFKEFMKHIKAISANNSFTNETQCKIYELFDFYLIVGNKLICMDVKNWSLYSDGPFTKTIERYNNKIKIINEIEELKGLGKEYIYLNTALHKNSDISVNPNIHFNDIPNVTYLDFFTNIVKYKFRSSGDKKINYYEEENCKYMQINPQLLQIVNG